MSLPATDVNTSTDQIYWKDHGFDGGEMVLFTNDTPANLFAIGGSTITGDTAYYVRRVDLDYIELAATAGGAKLDITSAGSGTHTMRMSCGESYAGIIHRGINAEAPDVIANNVIISKGARYCTVATFGILENQAMPVVNANNYIEGYYTGVYMPGSFSTRRVNDVQVFGNYVRDCYEAFIAVGIVGRGRCGTALRAVEPPANWA